MKIGSKGCFPGKTRIFFFLSGSRAQGRRRRRVGSTASGKRRTEERGPQGGDQGLQVPGDAHKSCPNARFITCNQATMNSAEITYVIFKPGCCLLLIFSLRLRRPPMLCWLLATPRNFPSVWNRYVIDYYYHSFANIIAWRATNLIANFMAKSHA